MLEVRGFKEAFARFAEDPDRVRLRDVLRDHTGELDELDFKEDWPEPAKIAKHIIGIANSGGGCIVLGVAQRNGAFDPVGLPSLKDKADVKNEIQDYLQDELFRLFKVHDFVYEAAEYERIAGKSFQVILIDDDPSHLPFMAGRDGNDVRRNAVYVRRGTSTEEANYAELQRLLNRRLETGYSSSFELDLREHLEQLKVLYEYRGAGANTFGLLLGWRTTKTWYRLRASPL